jgi:hypothetical protein
VLLLRLAVILNVMRKPVDLSRFQVDVNSSEIDLKIDTDYLEETELLYADLLREQQYLEAVGYRLNIIQISH